MKRTSANYRQIARYLKDTGSYYHPDHVAAIFDTFMHIDHDQQSPRYKGPAGFFNMVRDSILYVAVESTENLNALVKEAIE